MTLANPAWATNNFAVALPTLSGRVYQLEYRASLGDSDWISLSLVAGNGGVKRLTDSATTDRNRFYRVRQW